jgi:hypothetical protein
MELPLPKEHVHRLFSYLTVDAFERELEYHACFVILIFGCGVV